MRAGLPRRALRLARNGRTCGSRNVATHAEANYFGKDGMRSQGAFGGGPGSGSKDLAELLGQQQLDLGKGVDLSQPEATDDNPINYDPEGTCRKVQ